MLSNAGEQLDQMSKQMGAKRFPLFFSMGLGLLLINSIWFPSRIFFYLQNVGL